MSLIIFVLVIVENTANAVASPFWYPRSATSFEFNHLVRTTNVQSNESKAVWPPKQKDLDSNITNNSSSCSSMTWAHGIWSPSLNQFQDSIVDNKIAAARSVSDCNSHVSSRASNSVTLNQVERGRKSETYIGCRLFGIDLNNHHINPAHPEKELACPSYASSGAKSPTPVVSEADTNQNADLSKSSKEETKEVQAEGLPKERQSNQGCTTSNRTRTKVKHKF